MSVPHATSSLAVVYLFSPHTETLMTGFTVSLNCNNSDVLVLSFFQVTIRVNYQTGLISLEIENPDEKWYLRVVTFEILALTHVNLSRRTHWSDQLSQKGVPI